VPVFTAMLQVTGFTSMLISTEYGAGIVPSTDDEDFARLPTQVMLVFGNCTSHRPIYGRVSGAIARLCNLIPLEPAAACFLSDFECELLNVEGCRRT
jgi:hypothetical protein